jgi:hypothetical protein
MERPFGRPRHIRVENIKTPSSNRMADMDWTELAQDRDMWQALANMVKL